MSSSHAISASFETPYFSSARKQSVALQNVPPGEITTTDVCSDMLLPGTMWPETMCLFS